MKANFTIFSAVLALLLSPAFASAAIFSSDLTTSAGFHTIDTGDAATTFGFDYSTVGIPQNSGSDTLALKMEDNLQMGFGASSAVLTDMVFTGNYRIDFDMWMNYTGPLTFGGAGSTEFAGGVVGHDGTSDPFNSGANLTFAGDAGSSTDLRAHSGGDLLNALGDATYNPDLTGFNHPAIAGDLHLFPSVEAPADQVTLFPSQTDATRAGAAGFAWHHFGISVHGDAGTSTFYVDGRRVVTISETDGNGYTTDGEAGFVYADFFGSLAGEPAVTFGLFDNFVVTSIPEPSTFALLAFSVLGVVGLVRRKK